MKKYLLAIIAILLVAPIFAQEGQLDEKFTDYVIDTERRTVFMNAMNLDENDSKIFWTIYDEFEAELSKLRAESVENIREFVKDYHTLTNEQADKITKKSLELQKKRTALRSKYYVKMSKSLGAITASRFVEIDDIITMAIRLNVADQLPLVGDK
ncbi:MAG TPA: hypothetical protein DDX92_01910 [Flavobacteriales bacterium]|jgi:hypothetical protein|nr:hypothetical protein [Flavobacteriales bacterium]